MGDERSHICMRGKLKEKQREMKKIEASIIKRILRINSQFFSVWLWNWFHKEKSTKRRTQAKKGRQRKDKESKGQARKSQIKQLQWDYLRVSSCMYDFLASFGMHGTCMCVFDSLIFIGMGFSRCDSGFKPNGFHLICLGWIAGWFGN